MKTTYTTLTIHEVIHGNFHIDPEFQRGLTWKPKQIQLFVDSILRGYPVPNIILSRDNDKYSIIDGQQRIHALKEFYLGKIKLLDLKGDPKMPAFISNVETPWGGRKFNTIDPKAQRYFLDFKIPVCYMEQSQIDEERDVFIRLQSGTPLTGQEKRDALPGAYCTMVINLGGKKWVDKPEISKPGHDLFNTFIKEKGTDRGQVRQLVAQLTMLYFEQLTNDRFVDINAKSLDDYYYRNIGLDLESELCTSYTDLLDETYNNLSNYFGAEEFFLENHEIIHLILFVSKLKLFYKLDWQNEIIPSFLKFREELKKSQLTKSMNEEYWQEYGQFIGISAATKLTINKRHKFFSRKMYEFINYNKTRIDLFPIKELEYLNNRLKIYLSALQGLLKDGPDKYIDNIEFDILLPDTQNDNTSGNKIATKTISNILAYSKEGTIYYAKSFNQLYPKIFENYSGSHNYAMYVLGKIDNNGIATPPKNEFWNEIEFIEFEMDNKKFKVYRDDFDDYWPDRYLE